MMDSRSWSVLFASLLGVVFTCGPAAAQSLGPQHPPGVRLTPFDFRTDGGDIIKVRPDKPFGYVIGYEGGRPVHQVAMSAPAPSTETVTEAGSTSLAGSTTTLLTLDADGGSSPTASLGTSTSSSGGGTTSVGGWVPDSGGGETAAPLPDPDATSGSGSGWEPEPMELDPWNRTAAGQTSVAGGNDKGASSSSTDGLAQVVNGDMTSRTEKTCTVTIFNQVKVIGASRAESRPSGCSFDLKVGGVTVVQKAGVYETRWSGSLTLTGWDTTVRASFYGVPVQARFEVGVVLSGSAALRTTAKENSIEAQVQTHSFVKVSVSIALGTDDLGVSAGISMEFKPHQHSLQVSIYMNNRTRQFTAQVRTVTSSVIKMEAFAQVSFIVWKAKVTIPLVEHILAQRTQISLDI